ncbi:hypothetical protein QEV83_01245 [Methylocapsa sp. D3K7]|uniref:hypothetical protein n=1 Tax=Methylocapsa sp. D3K7 TaxID=3041435 RepID=UPI00244EA7EB|nr:hypothetical protein [Methylocapsa sp. D3K7]WGJ14967.1 hypothetical protein QEV83_01245 [Methylocapsa sp. D3K7]
MSYLPRTVSVFAAEQLALCVRSRIFAYYLKNFTPALGLALLHGGAAGTEVRALRTRVRMGRLRRLISVIFATAVAIGAALVFVPVACLVDPVTRVAGFALMEYALSTASVDFPDGPSDSDLVLFGRFVWLAAVLVCALPVIVVAWIGEIARTHGLLWYAGASAFAAASAPWITRATLHLPRAADYNFAELRFSLIFFLGGLISGWIYWLIAGRDAGNGLRRPDGLRVP